MPAYVANFRCARAHKHTHTHTRISSIVITELIIDSVSLENPNTWTQIYLFLPFPLFFLSFGLHQIWPGMTLAGTSVVPVSLPSTSFPHCLEHDFSKSVSLFTLLYYYLETLSVLLLFPEGLNLNPLHARYFDNILHLCLSISPAQFPQPRNHLHPLNLPCFFSTQWLCAYFFFSLEWTSPTSSLCNELSLIFQI